MIGGSQVKGAVVFHKVIFVNTHLRIGVNWVVDVVLTAQETRKETHIICQVLTYVITVEERDTTVEVATNQDNLARRLRTSKLHR